MRFSELVRLLERNGLSFLRRKAPFVIIQSRGMTGSFALIIMAQKKFPRAHVMLFSRPQE